MHPSIEFRDPQDLSLSPARKALPQMPGWEKDGPCYIALVENIRYRGIVEPLLIDPEDRIIRGADRWRAAKQLQLEKVPVIVRQGDAANIIVGDKALKKRLPNASALAFYIYPLMATAYEESCDHHLEYFKSHGRSPNLDAVRKPRKAEDFAQEIGVGRQYFFDAKKVHELFAAHPEPRDIEDDETGELRESTTFREYYSRRILLGEVRLGAVVAGIAGHLSSKRKPRPETKYFALFVKGFQRLAYFDKLADGERVKAGEILRETVAGLSDEAFTEFKRAVRAREKTDK